MDRHDGAWHRVSMPGVLSNGSPFGVGGPSLTEVWLLGGIDSRLGDTPYFGHWTGTRFAETPVPAGWVGHAQEISGTANDDIWAVGPLHAKDSSGRDLTIAAHWNGSAWQAVPLPTQEDPVAISALSATEAWLVTFTGQVLHWDGSSWQQVHKFAFPGIRVTDLITLSTNHVVLVGNQYSSDRHHFHGWATSYDGTQWKTTNIHGLVAGDWSLASISAAGKGVWAVGANANRMVILHLSGQQWHRQPSPIAHESALMTVAARSSTRAYAGGWFCLHPQNESCEQNAFLEYIDGQWRWLPSRPT